MAPAAGWAALSCSLLLVSGDAASMPGYPHVDDAKVMEIVNKMTLREKYEQLCIPLCPETDLLKGQCDPGWLIYGANFWYDLIDNHRLKIPGFRTKDGPKGITCFLGGSVQYGAPCPRNGLAPAYPAESLRAATWDMELEEEVGKAIGEVAKQLSVHIAFLPSINILPWLNWGRAQESYGEDPVFNGKMGAAVIRGVQSKGVMATAKHFLANNIEDTRWYVSANFDDKTLHDVYLKAWDTILMESSPEFIMTSYNRVQGHWANQNPKFIKILRERLGYEGSITTDWLATIQFVLSFFEMSPFKGKSFGWYGNDTTLLDAGVDMEMPTCNFQAFASRALANCDISDEQACHTANRIDQAVARLIRSKLRYGLIGGEMPPPPDAMLFPEVFVEKMKGYPRDTQFDNAKHDKLIQKVAERGFVLLENKDNFLPKPPSATKKVVVLGTADVTEVGDKGSSAVTPSGEEITVLQGLKEKYSSVNFLKTDVDAHVAEIKAADMVLLDVGMTWVDEGERIGEGLGGDRRHLDLRPEDEALVLKVAALNSNVVVILTSGNVIRVENFVDKVKSIMWIGYPGPMAGRALANILTGDVNPSGRMTSVTPKEAEDYNPKGITLEPWTTVEAQYPYAHGFKHMWSNSIKPRYPIGWGMSYTTFSFGEPTLSTPDGESPTGTIGVSVVVTNTGKVAGIETVQVYGQCTNCKQKRLPISLLTFAKADLAAGAKKTVELTFTTKTLAAFDADRDLWHLEKGSYEILVGPNLDKGNVKIATFTVAEDRYFDYQGTKGHPQVDGAGQRQCSAYKCKKDDDFNQIHWEYSIRSQIKYVILIPLSLFFWYKVFRCCCYVACCKCCKGKAEKVKTS